MARLNRNGLLSSCGVAKGFPGLVGAGTRRYDAYQFKACPAIVSQCVKVSLTPNSGTGLLFTEAYLTSFDHDNLAANYTADPGLSTSIGTPSTYSFNVSSGATFIIVVNEVDSGGGIGSNYTLTVSAHAARAFVRSPSTERVTTS